MTRLAHFRSLVMVLIGLLLLGISDSTASVAGTSIPDNEVTNNVSETADSASATIRISMYALPDG